MEGLGRIGIIGLDHLGDRADKLIELIGGNRAGYLSIMVGYLSSIPSSDYASYLKNLVQVIDNSDRQQLMTLVKDSIPIIIPYGERLLTNKPDDETTKRILSSLSRSNQLLSPVDIIPIFLLGL